MKKMGDAASGNLHSRILSQIILIYGRIQVPCNEQQKYYKNIEGN